MLLISVLFDIPTWGPNGGWAIKIGNPMFSFSCQPVSQNGVKEMHRQALSEIYPFFLWIKQNAIQLLKSYQIGLCPILL